MATKRDLGISYLLGTGAGLIATVTWLFLTSDAALSLLIPTVTAAVLSGTFVFIGYWMYDAGIAEETIWTVARWSALGLSFPVLSGVVLTIVDVPSLARTLVPGIFINLIAIGGVVGILLGLVIEMHREQSDLRRLNQRNTVLNRVLRHNIRNDMSVLRLHVDLLDDDAAVDTAASYEAIRRKIQEVVATSDTARRIDELDADSTDEGPIDVVELVRDRIEIVRATHPDVSVTLDLPTEAWADVGPLFDSVLDNLIENAIEHHDGTPSIDVAVDRGTGASPVTIRVSDDGPGIPQSEVELLDDGFETQLSHGTGLGLWLVKWFVEHYDGDLHIETPRSGGTQVVLELPAAPARVAERAPSAASPTQ